MNDETFNLSIRKFLRVVGVNSQREIEQAVAKAIAGGAIAGTESFSRTSNVGNRGTKAERQVRRRNYAPIGSSCLAARSETATGFSARPSDR